MKTKTTLMLLALASLLATTAPAQIANITNSKEGLAYNANATTVTESSYLVKKRDHTVLVNATAAAVTISLPPVSPKEYPLVIIKKVDSGSNTVTIDADGSQTIDGATTYVLSRQHQSVELHSNGSSWYVLGRESGAGVLRKLYLGTPRAVEANRAVASANMKVGTYTIANQPDVPRNVSVTHTAVSTVDTLGTVTFVGTDYNGDALTETLTPSNGTVVNGTKAFKTVTSITGAGWVIAAGNDTITAGYGSLIGLPVALPDATGTVLGTLDTTVAVKATTGTTLATSTVTEASGDGSKKLTIYLDK